MRSPPELRRNPLASRDSGVRQAKQGEEVNLAGHIAAVWPAHRVALDLFASRHDAVLSQVPMLLLLLAYTVVGLWVISLPFALT